MAAAVNKNNDHGFLDETTESSSAKASSSPSRGGRRFFLESVICSSSAAAPFLLGPQAANAGIDVSALKNLPLEATKLVLPLD